MWCDEVNAQVHSENAAVPGDHLVEERAVRLCEEGDLLSPRRGYSGVSAGGRYAIGTIVGMALTRARPGPCEECV